jgi:hypothetical protein
MGAEAAPSQLKTVIIELRSADNIFDRMHWRADIGTRNLAVPCEISEDEKKSIERSFRKVTFSLAGMIAVSLAGCGILLLRWHLPLLLGMLAGFLGSSTAGLRSALDRRANGIEDANGHQWPDPGTKKERFNRRIGVWFWYRPILGMVVGFFVYLAAQAGMLDRAKPEAGLAFFALLGGLFAKSLLDLLLEKFKVLFGV